MIKRIEIEEGISSLGDATQEDMDKWMEYLERRLSEEYPESEVSVKQHNISNGYRVYVETDMDEDGVPTDMDAEDEIRELKNLIWDREEWWK